MPGPLRTPPHKVRAPLPAIPDNVLYLPTRHRDFKLVNHGRVFTLTAMTQSAADWARANLPFHTEEPGKNEFLVDEEHIEDALDGALEDGFVFV